MAIVTETISIKLASNATIHASVTYSDVQNDGLKYVMTVWLTENNFNSVIGTPQIFEYGADGVVTNKQTNSVVAWAPGSEPNANVPGRLANAISAHQNILKALNANNQISGAPRG